MLKLKFSGAIEELTWKWSLKIVRIYSKGLIRRNKLGRDEFHLSEFIDLTLSFDTSFIMSS